MIHAIGVIVLDGAVIEDGCVATAGAVDSPAMLVPAGSVLIGCRPARTKRPTTAKDLELISRAAKGYVGLRAEYSAARGA